MGQREKGVGREPPSSLGRKGDIQLCPLSPAALGHQNRGGHGTALGPSGPPFLGTPDLCNPRRLPDGPCLPLHGPLGAAPMKLCRVFPPLSHGSMHGPGRSVSRSVGQSCLQGGCRMGPPSPGLHPNPAGRTQEALTLRRALLTVGSPSAHFMNKGNSTILWRCQKVNQTPRKSFCASGPQPSCCRAAPFPLGGRWSTAGHQAGLCKYPPAYPWPIRCRFKLRQGWFFSSRSYSFQLSQQSEHSPKTPCASQPAGASNWLGGGYATDKGRGADSQGGSTTRPSSRTGSGHFGSPL